MPLTWQEWITQHGWSWAGPNGYILAQPSLRAVHLVEVKIFTVQPRELKEITFRASSIWETPLAAAVQQSNTVLEPVAGLSFPDGPAPRDPHFWSYVSPVSPNSHPWLPSAHPTAVSWARLAFDVDDIVVRYSWYQPQGYTLCRRHFQEHELARAIAWWELGKTDYRMAMAIMLLGDCQRYRDW